jgi:hypothetical protein
MWMRVITASTLITAFVMLLLVGYWLLWPYEILTDRTNAVVTSTEIHAGDIAILKIHSCKHYDIPETTSRELIDGFVYMLPTVQTFYPVGCHDMTVWVPIPASTPPGEYRLSTTSEFHPNPLRTVSYHWETKQFLVLKSDRVAIPRRDGASMR